MFSPSTTANFLLLLWVEISHFLIVKDFWKNRERKSLMNNGRVVSVHTYQRMLSYRRFSLHIPTLLVFLFISLQMESDQSFCLLLKNILILCGDFLICSLFLFLSVWKRLLIFDSSECSELICLYLFSTRDGWWISCKETTKSQCAFDSSPLASGNGMEQEVKNRGDKADNAIIPQ